MPRRRAVAGAIAAARRVRRAYAPSLLLFALALLPLLAACEGVRDTAKAYGVGVREAPDEFAVIQNDPLEVPSDLESPLAALPAPVLSDPAAVIPSRAREEAGTLLLGKGADGAIEAGDAASTGAEAGAGGRVATAALSDVEQVLLRRLGDEGDPAASRQIRAELAAESAEDARPSLGERLLWWQSWRWRGPVVDAEAERERLRQLQAAGARITGEGVPVLGPESGQ